MQGQEQECDESKKKKEGKRLTNAFNTVSENSSAIEGALTKEAANSAEAKVHYAQALPFAVKGLLGTINSIDFSDFTSCLEYFTNL